MKNIKIAITLISICVTGLVNGQSANTWPTSGPAGIGTGTATPVGQLEVKNITSYNNSYLVNVSGVDDSFDPDKCFNYPSIKSQIGLTLWNGSDMGGLSQFNDGNNQTMALTSQGQIIADYGRIPSNQFKFFRLMHPSTNLANFSLEFRNISQSFSNPNNNWSFNWGSDVVAWNMPLSIGSYSGYPVRIYSDGGTPNKIADISVQYSKVGIGTETPNAIAKLDVNGNIYTNSKILIGESDLNKIGTNSLVVNGSAIFTKAQVKLNSNWPDYVFNKDYKLPSLTELENYIQLNHHLPEVPSASNAEKNGIDLGDNQALLLKKIEELTLIAIDQNKKIEEQSKKISALENNQYKK